MAGESKNVNVQHISGTKDVSIAAAGTTTPAISMGGSCILSLVYAAPDVNGYLTATASQTLDGTYQEVKKADGTQWTYPSDASSVTAVGSIGADAFKEFIGLGHVKLVASAAQTNGWTITARITG